MAFLKNSQAAWFRCKNWAVAVFTLAGRERPSGGHVPLPMLGRFASAWSASVICMASKPCTKKVAAFCPSGGSAYQAFNCASVLGKPRLIGVVTLGVFHQRTPARTINSKSPPTTRTGSLFLAIISASFALHLMRKRTQESFEKLLAGALPNPVAFASVKHVFAWNSAVVFLIPPDRIQHEPSIVGAAVFE